jgi:hypothetical protein
MAGNRIVKLSRKRTMPLTPQALFNPIKGSVKIAGKMIESL